MVKRVRKKIMNKNNFSWCKNKAEGAGDRKKGFEETRLLCLHSVVWEALLKSWHHGREASLVKNQGRLPRCPEWGFLCQNNRKEDPCDGILVGDGEWHQGDWQGSDPMTFGGQQKEFKLYSNTGAIEEISEIRDLPPQVSRDIPPPVLTVTSALLISFPVG